MLTVGRRLSKVATALIPLCFLVTPSAAAAGGVDVSAPRYDSPGGTVPAIVTAYGVPRGYHATITARTTGGGFVRCVGEVWLNRIRRTASRKCYVRLPDRPGAYRVEGRARLTRTGSETLARAGTGSRAILAQGRRSPRPLSLADVREIERCFNRTDRVWLTFDDGGSRTQVRRILATLARNRVRGRFFFTGAWAAENRLLMRRIRRSGHLVGNHSYSHAALSRSSTPEVVRQIDRGTRPSPRSRLLRPPFAAGALTSRLRRIAASRGYRLCRWTVDTYDWQGDTAARMAERVRHGDHLTPPVGAGGNILMHGAGRNTSTGLQRIIDAVKAKGLKLDPLRAPRRSVDAGRGPS